MATSSTRSSVRKSGRTAAKAKPTKQEAESDLSSSDAASDDADEQDVYSAPGAGDESDGSPADGEDSGGDGEDDDDDFGQPSKKNGEKRKRSTATILPRKTKTRIAKPAAKIATLSSAKKVVVERNGKRTKKTAGDNYPLASNDTKKSRKTTEDNSDDEEEDAVEPGEEDYSSYSDAEPGSSEDFDLEEGQEIKGRIFAAPKGGHVPPGQISRNTFRFLVNLQNPERNDREWFKVHEPAYRLAEQEWKDFVSVLSRRFRDVDPELPILPPKDLIHRIYRDVRFSNDKTPYKRHFSMSVTRSGRKGIWAGYFISVQPRGRSLIAGGVWAPGKNELASIRQSIKADSSQLRNIISAPDFTKLFGPASPSGRGKGARCNVFGHDDQLKVAPKGVVKDHADIDLLKLRSIAVVKNFTDAEVTSPEFMDILLLVASKITPLVHYLNSAIALPVPPAENAT